MSEPLKLLCLHGFRQSAAGFRTKTGGMRKNLKKKCEYVFIGKCYFFTLREFIKPNSENSDLTGRLKMPVERRS